MKDRGNYMNIAVVDDQNDICMYLKNFLLDIGEQYNISCTIDIYNDGLQFLQTLTNYDLVILDVEME